MTIPAVAVAAALLTFAAALAGCAERSAPAATVPLSVASLASVLHLDAFARWHAVRAALQVFTFFVLLWALAST